VFEALVLACLIGDPTDCLEFRNTRYNPPLNTYARCKARAMEMGSDVNKHLPNYRAISWKCLPVKEGTFTNVTDITNRPYR